MSQAAETSRTSRITFFTSMAVLSLLVATRSAQGQFGPESLATVQTKFGDARDPTGNVRLEWSGDHPLGEPANVDVLDGDTRAVVRSIAWPVGESTLTISDLPAGKRYVFRAENSNSLPLTQEDQEVINTNEIPFEMQLSLASCQSDDEDEEDCDIVVTGGSPGPPPGTWLLRIDEEEYVLAAQPETPEELAACSDCVARFGVDNKPTYVFCDSFAVSGAGAHQFEIFGYLSREQADLDYLLVGAFEAPMEILDCEAECDDGSATPFRRGDSNGDGTVDIADAVMNLFHQFVAPRSSCEEALDVEDDGALTPTDAVGILELLFLDGPAPPPPFDDCGADEDGDGLKCAEGSESC